VIETLDLQSEIVATEHPQQIEAELEQRGIASTQVIGGRVGRFSAVARERESRKPCDQPWW